MAKALREILSGNDKNRKSVNEDVFVIYHFNKTDVLAQFVVRSLLNEHRPFVDLGKGRAILCHNAHISGHKDHLHFMVKGSKIAAINKDGTAHDSSHGVQLQRWALDGMKQHYQEFTPPLNGLIEVLTDIAPVGLLKEGFESNEVFLTATCRLLAEAKAKE